MEVHHSPRHVHEKSPQLDPRYTVFVDVVDDSIEALPIEEHIDNDDTIQIQQHLLTVSITATEEKAH